MGVSHMWEEHGWRVRNSRKTNLQGVARPRHGHLAQRVPLLLDADARAAQPFELMQRLTLAADEPTYGKSGGATFRKRQKKHDFLLVGGNETRQWRLVSRRQGGVPKWREANGGGGGGGGETMSSVNTVE